MKKKYLSRTFRTALLLAPLAFSLSRCGQDSAHSILNASSKLNYLDATLVRGSVYDLSPITSLGRNAQFPAVPPFRLLSGILPSGLTFDPNSGHMPGVPTTLQTSTPYVATFTDSIGKPIAANFNLTVNERWTDAENTVAGLRHGSMLGLGWDDPNKILRLNTNSNYSSLDPDWTPQWDHLKAYYRMDNDWTDSSGNLNNGAVAGGTPVFDPVSKVGIDAGSFDGASYVSVPSSPSLNFTSQMTVMTWIYITSSTSNFWLFSKNPPGFGTGFGIAFEHPTGKIWPHLGIGGALHNPKSQGRTAYNQWNQVAVTYDSSYIRIYLNGVLDSLIAQTGAVGINGSPLYIGNSPGSPGEYLFGKIDELAIWDTALTVSEIRTIYDRQLPQASGYFSSRIFDGQGTTQWPGVRWKTVLPNTKSLVGDSDGNGAINASDAETSTAYDGITSTLTTGLKNLWHFDEGFGGAGGGGKDLHDSSGAGNWFDIHGTVLLGLPGRIGQAVYCDGSTSYATASDVQLPSGANPRTLSIWVHPTISPGVGATQSVVGWGSSVASQAYGIEIKNVAGTIQVNNYGFADDSPVNFPLPLYVWSHIAVTFDGTTAKTYVNGKFIGSSPHPGWNTTFSGTLVFGRSLAGADYFQGSIDELAIWDRPLTGADVLALYRRGANRLNMQVRSCGDSTCTTGSPQWTGPQGSSRIYFTEAFNSISNVEFGEMLPNEPKMLFSNFGSSVISAVPASRYFQYRLYMESDDTNALCNYSGAPVLCSPELRSVFVGPDF